MKAKQLQANKTSLATPLKRKKFKRADSYCDELKRSKSEAKVLTGEVYAAVLNSHRGNKRQARDVLERTLSKATERRENIDPATLAEGAEVLTSLYKEAGEAEKPLRKFSNSSMSKQDKRKRALALVDAGTNLKVNKGQVTEGLNCYKRALALDPTCACAHYNLGVVHGEQHNYQKALKYFKAAVKFSPSNVQALSNIGVIYMTQGKLKMAVMTFKKVLDIDSGFFFAKSRLATLLTDIGTQCKEKGHIKQGIKLYKEALFYKHNFSEAYYNMGVAYTELHKYQRAIHMYTLTIQFDPGHIKAYNNLGVLYNNARDFDTAINLYLKALEISPGLPQTLNNLAVSCTLRGDIEKAASVIDSALQHNPNFGDAWHTYAQVCGEQADVAGAIKALRRVLKLNPNHKTAGSSLMFLLNYVPSLHGNNAFKEHVAWGNKCQKMYKPRLPPARVMKEHSGKINIAYISPDFRQHSVSYFVEVPLKYYDRSRFTVTCLANVDKPDGVTSMLKKYPDRWINISRYNAHKVAEIIREHNIHILIDLAGHTSNNRLDVMALQSAKLQATWIGYPNTTGLNTIQYRLTDSHVDPEDTKQEYTEELVRIPGCFLCYTPPRQAPDVKFAPCLKNGYITFGSFNTLSKMNDRVVQLWSRVLLAVDKSRLVLKTKALLVASVRNRVWAQFKNCGVDPSRIQLLGHTATTRAHLALYDKMDISLDSFPYAGTTTTAEALHMGIPVLTLRTNRGIDKITYGDIHAANVGVSVLEAIGKPEWIADGADDFVDIAVRLSEDFSALNDQRLALRQQVNNSIFCDGPAFMKRVESIYTTWYDNELAE